VQSQGTLTETSLRNLLETAQGERATGILSVRDGDRTATLYLLFGSLVHAEAGSQVGDGAVVAALGWGDGEFTFDSKAKLPADETVTGTLADLISAADAAARENAGAPASESAAEPAAGEPDSAGASEFEAQSDAQPEAEAESEPEPEAQPETAAETEPAPAPETPSPMVEAPTLPPVSRVGAEAPHVPQPRRGVKHRPEPRHGREPIPVPAGEVTYDSLKTSFVDFPRLITTLERDGYTGYVRLLTDEASGLIFFRDGRALECVYDAGELLLGRDALTEFNDQVTRGLGVLDVVGLTPEVVEGLYELTVATPLYTELYASWVDFPSLLEFLADRTHTGSVTVRSAGKTGVIIFTDGKVTGAYTSESRDISDEVDQVRTLCEDPQAMIEVKAAEESARQPLNVEVITGEPAAPPPVYSRAPEPSAPPTVAPSEPEEPASTDTLPIESGAPEQSSGDTLPPLAASPGDTLPPVASPGDTMPPSPSPGDTLRPSAPAPAAADDGKAVDWDRVVDDLQQLAEESLGNRSRKVKDILAGAERSRAGVERAIDEIPTISLLFVDSSRLEALAQDMRTRLQSEL
jgi:uncharacterized protein DUF4388